MKEKYDYSKKDSAKIEDLAAGWFEDMEKYNHKWSEWKTEKHTIDAVKIDGKWYYECWDDED